MIKEIKSSSDMSERKREVALKEGGGNTDNDFNNDMKTSVM